MVSSISSGLWLFSHFPTNGGFTAFTVKPNPILWLKSNKSSGFSLAPKLPLICTPYVFLPSQAQQVPVSIRSNGSTPSRSTKERYQVVGYPLKTPLIHRDETEAVGHTTRAGFGCIILGHIVLDGSYFL
ncbi:hypothetical protein HELRODRAFT_184797 [Helobdella robusta]|uniref:Uncharacterized protein n=1 Tax=Helobdella robusta TaxID=6412 RepID=T1FM05_HELRO|nr:hypothetical protein HELRODRAFT_184797 [Helobdella robusta]ESN97456.1 hypothetical protein HELRODRAFT_184797 [Helobdella robusta]